MNKTFFVLALTSLCAVPGRAATLSQVCGRFMDGGAIQRCLQAAQGRRTDSKALDLCGRFMDGDTIIRCVGDVAGRSYTDEEVALCGRFMDGDSILNCLKTAGRAERREGERCEGLPSARQLVRDCEARFSSAEDQLSCIEAGAGL